MNNYLTDYPIYYNNNFYDFENGIKLLKNSYNSYNELPKELKCREIKKNWDKYEKIDESLYNMSLSKDKETLSLLSKLLLKNNISFRYSENYNKEIMAIAIICSRNDRYLKHCNKLKIDEWNK